MKSFMNLRFGAIVAVLAVASTLAACGGGGDNGSVDENPTPVCRAPGVLQPNGDCKAPAPTPATGSITQVAGCFVPDGQLTCNASVVYTTANASTPRLTAKGVSVSSLASGTVTFPIIVGSSPLVLTDGAATLDTKSVTASCNDGSAVPAGGTVCTKTMSAFHYSAFNLTIRNDQGNTLWVVDDQGNETQLVNSTGFNTSATISFPLTNCALYDLVLPDNRPLASCTTPGAGNARRNFPINPSTKELMTEWAGVVPAGAVLHDVPYGTFGDTPYAAFDVGRKGAYIDVPGGVLYFTNSDHALRRTTNSFTTNSVVNSGSHILLWRFEAK